MVYEAKLIRLDKSGEKVEEYIINKKEFTFGKFPFCDVSIDDPRVERVHCKLVIDAWDRVNIINCSNEHPIKINNVSIEVKRPLLHKHVLDVLENKFIFECKRSDSENNFTTPQKSANADRAPNSCPDLRFSHHYPRRFTVHSFFYSTYTGDDIEKKDTNNENISQINSLTEVNEIEKDKKCNVDDITDSTCNLSGLNLHNDIAKIMVIDSTPDKKCEILKQNICLNYSDMKITSFSPRIAGVQIEKSFVDFISCTPKSTYSTPKGVMPKMYKANQSLKYVTPNTSKKRYLQEAPNSPMYLVDFTTPIKFAPKSPIPNLLIKSCNKKETSKLEMPSCSKPSSTPIYRKSVSLDTPISVESSASSIIEIDDDSDAIINSASKTPTKRFTAKLTTPKRSSPSLMKRILLKSTQKSKAGSILSRTPTTPKLHKSITPRRLAQNSRQYEVMRDNSLSLMSEEQLQKTTPHILQKLSGTKESDFDLKNKNNLTIDCNYGSSKTDSIDSNIVSENFGETVETSVKNLNETFDLSAKDNIMTEKKIENDVENDICLTKENKHSNSKMEFLFDEECFNETQKLQTSKDNIVSKDNIDCKEVNTSENNRNDPLNKRRIERRVSMPTELASKCTIQFRRSSLKSESLNKTPIRIRSFKALDTELKDQYVEESMGAIVEDSYTEETIIKDSASSVTVKNASIGMKSEISNIEELKSMFDNRQNERIYEVLDDSEYNYGKEVLKCEDDVSETEFEGVQELLATPRISSTPIPKNNKTDETSQVLLNSPTVDVFKTPRGKNLMMTVTPSSEMIKQSFASKEFLNCTEYNLNDSNDKLEKLFESPVALKFNNQDLTERSQNMSTNQQVSEYSTPVSNSKLDKIEESPFSSTDIITDLPEIEVQNWIKKIEVSNLDEELIDDVSRLHKRNISLKSSIEHSLSIDPLHLSVNKSGNTMKTTEISDPLSLSVAEEQNLDLLTLDERSMTPIESEMSGIHLLDESEDSFSLKVSDTESELPISQNSKMNKIEELKSNETFEALVLSDTDSDLADIDNEDEYLNLKKSNFTTSAVKKVLTKKTDTEKHLESPKTSGFAVDIKSSEQSKISYEYNDMSLMANEDLENKTKKINASIDIKTIKVPLNMEDDMKSSLQLGVNSDNTSFTSLLDAEIIVESNIQSEDYTLDASKSKDAMSSQYLDNRSQVDSTVQSSNGSEDAITLSLSEVKDRFNNSQVSPKVVLEKTVESNIAAENVKLDVSICSDKFIPQSEENMSLKSVLEKTVDSNIANKELFKEFDLTESYDKSTLKYQDNRHQKSSKFVIESNIETDNEIILNECDNNKSILKSQDNTIEKPTEFVAENIVKSNMRIENAGVTDISKSDKSTLQSQGNNDTTSTKFVMEKSIESVIESKEANISELSDSDDKFISQSEVNDKISSKLVLENIVESDIETRDIIGVDVSFLQSQDIDNESSSKCFLQKTAESNIKINDVTSTDPESLRRENEMASKYVLEKTMDFNIERKDANASNVSKSNEENDIQSKDNSYETCSKITLDIKTESIIKENDGTSDISELDKCTSKSQSSSDQMLKFVLKKTVETGDVTTLEAFGSNNKNTLQSKDNNDGISSKHLFEKAVQSNITSEKTITLDVSESDKFILESQSKTLLEKKVKSNIEAGSSIVSDALKPNNENDIQSQGNNDVEPSKCIMEKSTESHTESEDTIILEITESTDKSTLKSPKNGDEASSKFVTEKSIESNAESEDIVILEVSGSMNKSTSQSQGNDELLSSKLTVNKTVESNVETKDIIEFDESLGQSQDNGNEISGKIEETVELKIERRDAIALEVSESDKSMRQSQSIILFEETIELNIERRDGIALDVSGSNNENDIQSEDNSNKISSTIALDNTNESNSEINTFETKVETRDNIGLDVPVVQSEDNNDGMCSKFLLGRTVLHNTESEDTITLEVFDSNNKNTLQSKDNNDGISSKHLFEKAVQPNITSKETINLDVSETDKFILASQSKSLLEKKVESNIEAGSAIVSDALEPNNENDIQSQGNNDVGPSKCIMEKSIESNTENADTIILEVSNSTDKSTLQSQDNNERMFCSFEMDKSIESDTKNGDAIKLEVSDITVNNDKMSSIYAKGKSIELNTESRDAIILKVSDCNDKSSLQAQDNIDGMSSNFVMEKSIESNTKSGDAIILEECDSTSKSTLQSQGNDELLSSKLTVNNKVESNLETKNTIGVGESMEKSQDNTNEISSKLVSSKLEETDELNIERKDAIALEVFESDKSMLQSQSTILFEETVELNIERGDAIASNASGSNYENDIQSEDNSNKISSTIALDNANESNIEITTLELNVETRDNIELNVALIQSQSNGNKILNKCEMEKTLKSNIKENSSASEVCEFEKSTPQTQSNSNQIMFKKNVEYNIEGGDSITLNTFDSNDKGATTFDVSELKNISTVDHQNHSHQISPKLVPETAVESNIQDATESLISESINKFTLTQENNMNEKCSIFGLEETVQPNTRGEKCSLSKDDSDQKYGEFVLKVTVESNNEREEESNATSTLQSQDNIAQKSSDFILENTVSFNIEANIDKSTDSFDALTIISKTDNTDKKKEIDANKVHKVCDEFLTVATETQRKKSVNENINDSKDIIKAAPRRGRRKLVVQDEPEPKEILQKKITKIIKPISKLNEFVHNNKETVNNQEDIPEENKNKTVGKSRRGRKRAINYAEPYISPSKDIEVSPTSKNIEKLSVNKLKEDELETSLKNIEVMYNATASKTAKEKSTISATKGRIDKNAVEEEIKEPDQISTSRRGTKRKPMIVTNMDDIPSSSQLFEEIAVTKMLINVENDHDTVNAEISTHSNKRGKKQDIHKKKQDEIVIFKEQDISQMPTTSKRGRTKKKDMEEKIIAGDEKMKTVESLTVNKRHSHDKQEAEISKRPKLSTGGDIELEDKINITNDTTSTTKRGRRKVVYQKDSGNVSIHQDKTDIFLNIESSSTHLPSKRKIIEIEEPMVATKEVENSLNTNNPAKRSHRNKKVIDKDMPESAQSEGDVLSKVDAKNELKDKSVNSKATNTNMETVLKKVNNLKEHNAEIEEVDKQQQTSLNDIATAIATSKDSNLIVKEHIKTRNGRKAISSHNEESIAKTSKKSNKLNTSDIDEQRKRNVPRRAATAKNYDESSDIETNIKITDSEKTIKTEIATTSRGRTRKPIALVQEYLEKARSKTDSPKKIVQLEENPMIKNQNNERELKATATVDTISNKRTRSAKAVTDTNVKESANERVDRQKMTSSILLTGEVISTHTENESPMRKRGRKPTASKTNMKKMSTAPTEAIVVKEIQEKTEEAIDKPDLKITNRNEKDDKQKIKSLTLPTEDVISTHIENEGPIRKRGRKVTAAKTKIAEPSITPTKSDVVEKIHEKTEQVINKKKSTRSKKVSFELETQEAVKVKRTTTRTKKK